MQKSIHNNSEPKINSFGNLTIDELIDIYKNFKFHYAGSGLSSNYDSYFETYSNKVLSELANRGIEIIVKNNELHINYTDKLDYNVIQSNLISLDYKNNLNAKPKSNSKLTKNSSLKNTYEVDGESMLDYGINSGDIVSCKSFKSKISKVHLTFAEIGNLIDNKLIIAKLQNGIFIKVAEYHQLEKNNHIILKSFNPKFYNFKITESTKFKVLGVVEELVRKF